MPKRGENIYKRKDGRWEGRHKCGICPDGKTKYIYVYGKSYCEVKERVRQFVSDEANHPTHKLTLKEMCLEWLSSSVHEIKESTLSNYRMKLEKYIFTYFGEIKYEQLTGASLNEFINYMLDEKALSPKYVSDILSMIKSIAKYAHKKYGYTNTAADIAYPKSKSIKKKEALSISDFKALLRELENNTDLAKLGVLISSYTGIRIGELCALKWSDIDFYNNVLSINKTVQRISQPESGGTHIVFLPPKSKSSERLIPLPDFLIEYLSSFRSSDEYFILSGNEKCIEPRTMQYRFKAILKRAGLPSVNFHILRHTFATNCLNLGFDIKTLSEILGHSSVQITMNCYIHSSLERKRQCMMLIKSPHKPSELSSKEENMCC